MPHHRVLRAHQDDAIAQIERQGEVIVQVTPDPLDLLYIDVYTRTWGLTFDLNDWRQPDHVRGEA